MKLFRNTPPSLLGLVSVMLQVCTPLRWVVSAAHCSRRYNKESLWKVLAGRHDLDKAEEPEEQLVGISRIISHQEYNSRTKESDVALLKLEHLLVFNL
ncbi:PREDICTED: kallikrein-14-like isoform X2 [Poecilia mexicana]|uniref:kallikrein-14-like isoform X2 n=1 Tax=Poecilia mexicana TaxID=48701 RepID=UPI00072EDDB9|nr:PREDICTED: kallikrein-14-like isoform X2 [Poecilia mexicana]